MENYNTEEAEDQEQLRGNGNTGLPFGLCAKYGIRLPRNATPRDAWNALKDKTGLTPEQVYRDLREKENKKREQAQSIYDDEAPSRPKFVPAKTMQGAEWPEKEREFISLARQWNIEHRKVTRNDAPMESDEIIAKVAGGDKTNGSCVSVALAYIGNVLGFDVTDFRGGQSQAFFATRRNVKELLSFKGIGGVSLEGYNDFTMANTVLSRVDSNREYLFIVGKHATIIRKQDTGFEYLELQSPTDNGYYSLTRTELKRRFGCQKTHTIYGFNLKNSCHLVPIENFRNNNAFIEALGFLNTAVNEQKKGEDGNVK